MGAATARIGNGISKSLAHVLAPVTGPRLAVEAALRRRTRKAATFRPPALPSGGRVPRPPQATECFVATADGSLDSKVRGSEHGRMPAKRASLRSVLDAIRSAPAPHLHQAGVPYAPARESVSRELSLRERARPALPPLVHRPRAVSSISTPGVPEEETS